MQKKMVLSCLVLVVVGSGCAKDVGWNVNFGVNPISAVHDEKAFNQPAIPKVRGSGSGAVYRDSSYDEPEIISQDSRLGKSANFAGYRFDWDRWAVTRN